MGVKDWVGAPHCILAIDPGQSGAVFKLGRGHFEARRDFKTLRDISAGIRDLAQGVDCAVIEAVHAMPGQGVCSMFSFGRSTGVAFGSLYLALPESCPVVEVAPQKWQNWFRQEMGMEKSEVFDSRLIAQKIVPGFEPLLARVKDHNTADAILMAIWAHSTRPDLN